MKSPLPSLILLLASIGTVHAAPGQATASLGLSQNMSRATMTVALTNAISSESTPSRSTAPLQAAQQATAEVSDAAGFEVESGLMLTLAGVMALVVVSRRRLPR